MKKTLPFALMALMGFSALAQTIKPADVYATNLEENMYFERYNAQTNTVEGVHFLVLSDGENSKWATPAFDVSIYIGPEGNLTKETVQIVKVYNLEGIYHMGSHEFKGENISLNEVEGLVPGQTYRLGVWVNSNEAFEENPDNNAYLFATPIVYKGKSKGGAPSTPKKATKEDSDGWDDEAPSPKEDSDDDL
jgi:hypothetical protein